MNGKQEQEILVINGHELYFPFIINNFSIISH